MLREAAFALLTFSVSELQQVLSCLRHPSRRDNIPGMHSHAPPVHLVKYEYTLFQGVCKAVDRCVACRRDALPRIMYAWLRAQFNHVNQTAALS